MVSFKHLLSPAMMDFISALDKAFAFRVVRRFMLLEFYKSIYFTGSFFTVFFYRSTINATALDIFGASFAYQQTFFSTSDYRFHRLLI
jgi:hypothetical protein